jgi:hypothetical protein
MHLLYTYSEHRHVVSHGIHMQDMVFCCRSSVSPVRKSSNHTQNMHFIILQSMNFEPSVLRLLTYIRSDIMPSLWLSTLLGLTWQVILCALKSPLQKSVNIMGSEISVCYQGVLILPCCKRSAGHVLGTGWQCHMVHSRSCSTWQQCGGWYGYAAWC